MDSDDEVALEMEAIESIFPDEYEVRKPDPPAVISVRVDPDPDDEGKMHVGVTLVAHYPAEGYPDAACELNLEDAKGLNDSQLSDLREAMDASVAENEGAPVVFPVVDAIKMWLSDNNKPPEEDSMHARMLQREREAELADRDAASQAERKKQIEQEQRERERLAAAGRTVEDERRRVLEGTPVNPTTFIAWRMRFEAEHAERFAELEGAADKKAAGTPSAAAPEAAGGGGEAAEVDSKGKPMTSALAAAVRAHADLTAGRDPQVPVPVDIVEADRQMREEMRLEAEAVAAGLRRPAGTADAGNPDPKAAKGDKNAEHATSLEAERVALHMCVESVMSRALKSLSAKEKQTRRSRPSGKELFEQKGGEFLGEEAAAEIAAAAREAKRRMQAQAAQEDEDEEARAAAAGAGPAAGGAATGMAALAAAVDDQALFLDGDDVDESDLDDLDDSDEED